MTRVATVGADVIADMRAAADGRLRRRFLALGIVIVALVAALAGALYLAWPRIQTWPWVQQMLDDNPPPDAGQSSPGPVTAPSGSASAVPATGDALAVTGWASWSSEGGGAFGAQIMLRRETAVGDGQPGVFFLYPVATAPGFATIPLTYRGQSYKAVVTAPMTWVFHPSNLATHADIICDGSPMTCSGIRTVYDANVTPDQAVPALVANAVQNSADGTVQVLSANPVNPGGRVDECRIITCG